MAKTMGVYQITSKTNPDFRFIGSSTQVETCTKDYINWCKSGKAPKKIQDEYYNNKSDASVFIVTILEVAQDMEQLADAKVRHGLGTAGGKPVKHLSSKPEPVLLKAFEAKFDQDEAYWKEIYKEYEAGASVKNICERIGCTSKIFYANIHKLLGYSR